MTCAVLVNTPETVVVNTVKPADQKQAVACAQLGDGDALASGRAKSPVELRSDVSRESTVGG